MGRNCFMWVTPLVLGMRQRKVSFICFTLQGSKVWKPSPKGSTPQSLSELDRKWPGNHSHLALCRDQCSSFCEIVPPCTPPHLTCKKVPAHKMEMIFLFKKIGIKGGRQVFQLILLSDPPTLIILESNNMMFPSSNRSDSMEIYSEYSYLHIRATLI